MLKSLGFLAGVVIAIFSANAARASMVPPQLSLFPVMASEASPELVSPKLAIEPTELVVPSTVFVVGGDAVAQLTQSFDASLRFGTPEYLRSEADFIRDRISSPGLLEQLVDLFDIEEIDQPWATTTTVRLLIGPPVLGQFTPFVSFAHQVDADEDFERLGMGAGLLYTLQKNVTIGTEMLYYGTDHPSLGGGSSPEAIFMSRLQIDF